ncbi:hypothetical protein FVE85_1484 [Porphyridium purpureum]|uniref:Uncharacterized protein n=1 Tax=Porphyridium purpureum TaxID=35688 RepID=A0A5J4YV01_PORPP|nr:hypothetical protein FVE85_1484 [Porphyridium purpureum]|eukprot:POR7524..scf209_3
MSLQRLERHPAFVPGCLPLFRRQQVAAKVVASRASVRGVSRSASSSLTCNLGASRAPERRCMVRSYNVGVGAAEEMEVFLTSFHTKRSASKVVMRAAIDATPVGAALGPRHIVIQPSCFFESISSEN